MKRTLVIIGILTGFLIVKHVEGLKFREKSLALAHDSYYIGCANEARRICGAISDATQQEYCLTDASVNCPVGADAFVDWLRGEKEHL